MTYAGKQGDKYAIFFHGIYFSMLGMEGKRIHFIGVGGVSMCALAEFCLLNGARVSGSDRVFSKSLRELSRKGAEVYAGTREDIIPFADEVIYSSAVPETDGELSRARREGIKVTERQDFLARVANCFDTVAAVAGTHGKTTVTAMTAHILKECGLAFVAHIGGEPADGGNLTVFPSDGKIPCGIFLTEACEYKRHLLALSPDIAVVTNIECDHPDSYSDLSEVKEVFAKFVEKCPLTVIHGADSELCTNAHIDIYANESTDETETAEGSGPCEGKVRSYERRDICSYRVTRVLECTEGQTATVVSGERILSLFLPVRGHHNLEDAVFALALSAALGADPTEACKALSTFAGVRRRFEFAGRLSSAQIVFDYAHHPTELNCALSLADTYGKVLAVFQPHTYSRTARYMDDFTAVLGSRDNLVLMPTYAARESVSAGADTSALAENIKSKFPKCKLYKAKSTEETVDYVKKHASAFDMIIFLGAGDIYALKDILGNRVR